jgi:hypothetical protein
LKSARRVAAVAAVVGAVTTARSARAIVLDEDPLEGSSTTIGGSLRSFNFVMHGGPLTDPGAPPDANPASVSVDAIRAYFEMKRGDAFSLVAHDQLTTTVSSLSLGALGGPLALGTGNMTPPVWLPLQSTLTDGDRFTATNRVDWLYGRYRTSWLTITLGRQPITIGRAVLWTPEDLLAPFSPLQINTDFKPGVDALRVDVALGETATWSTYGVAGKATPDASFDVHGDGSAALTRLEKSFATTRLGLMGGYVREDAVGGADLFLDLGHGVDLHGEATVTYVPDVARRPFGNSVFARAVAGSTFAIGTKVHATIEGDYDGSGAPTPGDYLTALASPRFRIGEVYDVGRYYAGASCDWEASALLHVGAAVIANVTDPSALASPFVRYDVGANAQLVAGAFLPIGARTAYAPDGTPTPRSEFGLYPFLYHVDAKVYF